jgi:hypothetical protein
MSSETSFSKGKRPVEIHILIGSIVMHRKIQSQGNFSAFSRTGKTVKVIDGEIKQNAVQSPPASALSLNTWTRSTSHITTVCPSTHPLHVLLKDADCIPVDAIIVMRN